MKEGSRAGGGSKGKQERKEEMSTLGYSRPDNTMKHFSGILVLYRYFAT